MRTRQEILDRINDAANGESALNELQQNTSKASWWKAIKDIMAFVIHTLEVIFEKHRQDVNALILKTEPGTLSWYRDQALAYQKGGKLIVSNNRLVYNNEGKDAKTIEEENIIARAAIEERTDGGGMLMLIKVAKQKEGGLGALDEDELRAFKEYIGQIKFAGTKVDAISSPPAKIALNLTVELDELLFDSEGKRLGTEEKPVPLAIEKYLKTFPFNEPLYASKIVDTAQAVEGVIDIKLNRITADGVDVDRKITLTSGYAVFDQDENNSSIDYVLA